MARSHGMHTSAERKPLPRVCLDFSPWGLIAANTVSTAHGCMIEPYWFLVPGEKALRPAPGGNALPQVWLIASTCSSRCSSTSPPMWLIASSCSSRSLFCLQPLRPILKNLCVAHSTAREICPGHHDNCGPEPREKVSYAYSTCTMRNLSQCKASGKLLR